MIYLQCDYSSGHQVACPIEMSTTETTQIWFLLSVFITSLIQTIGDHINPFKQIYLIENALNKFIHYHQ